MQTPARYIFHPLVFIYQAAQCPCRLPVGFQADDNQDCVSQKCCVHVEQASLPTNAADVLRRIESSPWPEVQPNIVSYTSVIDAYAKSANYSAVRSVPLLSCWVRWIVFATGQSARVGS